MALVYRYLGFVEYGENLPKGVKVVPSSFLSEVCGIDVKLMEEAIRWLQAQEGFDVEAIARAFYCNFAWIDQTAEYFRLASCLNELTDFGSIVTNIAKNVVRDFIKQPVHNQTLDHSLLRTLDLSNGLYRHGIFPSEHFFRLIYVIMSVKLPVKIRITMLLRLLDDLAQNLKKDNIVERLVSAVGILRASGDVEGRMTLEEVHKVTHALICFDLLPHDTLKYDKMEKLESYFSQWCNGSLNLRKTLAAFAALQLKFYEEFTQIANRIWFHAMENDRHQHKLAILHVHLQKETFKDQKDFLEVSTELFTAFTYATFSSLEATAGYTEMSVIQFLVILYNEGAIKHDLIEGALGLLSQLPPEIGYPRFVGMFPDVEDKLKRESSKEVYEGFVDFMKNRIIATCDIGIVPSLKEWLMKKELEKTDAANSLKRQQAAEEMKKNPSSTTMEPADIGDATLGYCQGLYNLDQLLKQFEAFKTIPNNNLGFIPHETLVLAMRKNADHKKLAILLKNLINKTFRDRAEELYRISFAVFHHHVKKHLEYTSEVNLERNMCFVNFLAELFTENVIGEKLIVESLDMLLADWGQEGDDCFTELFIKVYIKLNQKVAEEKFQEYAEHLEKYIIFNHDGEIPSEWLRFLEWNHQKREETESNDSHPKEKAPTSHSNQKPQTVEEAVPVKAKLEEKISSTAAKKSTATVRQKNRVPKRVQRMIINLHDLKVPEKSAEIIENLREILNSENRKQIFVRHMLERSESGLAEILLHAKLLVALAKISQENFKFKDCLTSTIHAEYLRTNGIAKSSKKAKIKLNRIEVISGELWRNNLMATKKFASILMSKNMRLLPTESLAHLSLIVGKALHSEGNSKLKLAVRQFEPFIHDSIMEGWEDLKDDLEDVGAELQMLLSYEESLSVSQS